MVGFGCSWGWDSSSCCSAIVTLLEIFVCGFGKMCVWGGGSFWGSFLGLFG